MASVSASYATGQERGLFEKFHTCALIGRRLKGKANLVVVSFLNNAGVFPHDLFWNPGFTAAKVEVKAGFPLCPPEQYASTYVILILAPVKSSAQT
jgi:hypothetical protein